MLSLVGKGGGASGASRVSGNSSNCAVDYKALARELQDQLSSIGLQKEHHELFVFELIKFRTQWQCEFENLPLDEINLLVATKVEELQADLKKPSNRFKQKDFTTLLSGVQIITLMQENILVTCRFNSLPIEQMAYSANNDEIVNQILMEAGIGSVRAQFYSGGDFFYDLHTRQYIAACCSSDREQMQQIVELQRVSDNELVRKYVEEHTQNDLITLSTFIAPSDCMNTLKGIPTSVHTERIYASLSGYIDTVEISSRNTLLVSPPPDQTCTTM